MEHEGPKLWLPGKAARNFITKRISVPVFHPFLSPLFECSTCYIMQKPCLKKIQVTKHRNPSAVSSPELGVDWCPWSRSTPVPMELLWMQFSNTSSKNTIIEWDCIRLWYIYFSHNLCKIHIYHLYPLVTSSIIISTVSKCQTLEALRPGHKYTWVGAHVADTMLARSWKYSW